MSPRDARPPKRSAEHPDAPAAGRAVIGLEIHARLATRSKLFCGCENGAGGLPNVRICPVCTGFPGTLPYPNREALRLALRAALLLGCEIASLSRWERKNYFYPDLPKGYQITQHDEPLARGGALRFSRADGSWCRVALRGLHLEEDAGKSIHEGLGDDASGLDFNRCGVPLVEIVTEPCLDAPEDAARCLEQLRALLRAGGVSDATMEAGSLRCDANVSLRGARGAGGERVEIKNLNSFRFLRAALEHEIDRQGALAGKGRAVRRETRLWDERARETRPMRDKEELRDYRYFPDPDLPPLEATPTLLEEASRKLPETPDRIEERLRDEGLHPANARSLALDPEALRYFAAAREAGADPRALETWMLVEAAGRIAQRGKSWASPGLAPAALAELIVLVEGRKVTASQAKTLLDRALDEHDAPAGIARREGIEALSDESALRALAERTLARFPDQVAAYRSGKTALIGFLVGRLMEESGGRADARRARALLESLLEGDGCG